MAHVADHDAESASTMTGPDDRSRARQRAVATGGLVVFDWIERHFDGPVVHMERLARWRPGWMVDVVARTGTVALYVRGDRNSDFPSPYNLAHEHRVHDLFEAHAIPVPHVYGAVDMGGTGALVMDRVLGVQGLAFAEDDRIRRRLMTDWVDVMHRMQGIELDELARAGFDVPRDPEQIVWSGAIARLEQHYLQSVAAGARPDPVIDFLRRWLRRNRPQGRNTAAFVTWDAAQFLHHAGALTALIDFELAHVGDPYMDLAPLRSRDTMEPFGDLHAVFARYETLTGVPIDYDVVRYFEVAQLTATLMLQLPVTRSPEPGTDLVTHIVWYVQSALYALDVLGELRGVLYPPMQTIDAPKSFVSAAHRHLVDALHASARGVLEPNLSGHRDSGFADNRAGYRQWTDRCNYRLARHLQRVDEVGAVVEQSELADVSALLAELAPAAKSVTSRAGADAALVGVIEAWDRSDSPDSNVERQLMQYLYRRMQRASMLLGPPDSQLVQHVPMQRFPDS